MKRKHTYYEIVAASSAHSPFAEVYYTTDNLSDLPHEIEKLEVAGRKTQLAGRKVIIEVLPKKNTHSKRKSKDKKKKFVVWLHNRTDSRDDEWEVVWAVNHAEAQSVQFPYDTSRFHRGDVYTAQEFYKNMGIRP